MDERKIINMSGNPAEVFIKVRLQYFGAVRASARKSGDDADLHPDTTLYQLLQKLSGEYGEGFQNEIFQECGGMLRDDLTLTINGSIIKHANAAEMKLNQGDVIALFPIFPGGG